MKVKNKFFIFALILSLILTVTAVAATEDISFDQSELKTSEIDEIIEEPVTEELTADTEITEDDFDAYLYSSFISIHEDNNVIEYKYPKNATGTVEISVNGNPVYTHQIVDGDDKEVFNRSRLGITEIGEYTIICKYNSDLIFLNSTITAYLVEYNPIYDEYDNDNDKINIWSFPEDGQLIIYNGIDNYTIDVNKTDDIYIPLYDMGISSKGKYELIFKYVSNTYDVIFKKANITVKYVGPSTMIFNVLEGQMSLFVSLYSQSYSGNLTILIDGEQYYNQAISKHNQTYIYANDLNKNITYGKHTALVKIVNGTEETILDQDSFYASYFYVHDDVFTLFGASYYSNNETLSLPVIMSSDAQGNLTVEYNGKSKKLEKNSSGEYNFEINTAELNEGENILNFTFTSANVTKYPTISYCYKLFVSRTEDVNVEGNLTVEYGSPASIKLKAPESYEVAEVFLDGKSYGNYSMETGIVTIDLGLLSPGNHYVSIVYGSMDLRTYKISYFNKTLNLSVNRKPVSANLTVTADDIIVGENATINVSINESATGKVTINIDGEEKLINIVNGKGNYTIPNLSAGDKNYAISFAGDDYFLSDTQTVSFKVNRKSIKFTIEIANVEVETPITVKITSDKSFTGNLIVKIGSNNVLVSMVNGEGTNTSLTLPVSAYTATLEFAGNEEFNPSQAQTAFNVTNKPGVPVDPGVELIINNVEEGVPVTVIVKTNNLFTGDVKITSEAFNATVQVRNGEGNTSVTLPVGEYSFKVIFEATEMFKASNKTTSFKVTAKPVPVKIIAQDSTVFYTAGSYSVTVYGSDAKLAANTPVIFKINGKQVGIINTNDKGVATLMLTQAPGSYEITIEALGISLTKKLTVKHIVSLKTVKVKKSAKKLVLKATVKIGNKAVAKKKVTFKFNGKKYTAKTNKKGVAKLTIKSKVLKKLKAGKKVTYQATYLKDTVKKTVKVRK